MLSSDLVSGLAKLWKITNRVVSATIALERCARRTGLLEFEICLTLAT